MTGFFFWWNATACGKGNEGELNAETVAILEAHLIRNMGRVIAAAPMCSGGMAA